MKDTITITPHDRPDGTRVASIEAGPLHAVYSLRADGTLQIESGNMLLEAEEQIAAALADGKPRVIKPQPKPQTKVNAARQGICPKCGTYCNGDCEA